MGENDSRSEWNDPPRPHTVPSSTTTHTLSVSEIFLGNFSKGTILEYSNKDK